MKFRIWEEEKLYYLCGKNKGADQLCGYSVAVVSKGIPCQILRTALASGFTPPQDSWRVQEAEYLSLISFESKLSTEKKIICFKMVYTEESIRWVFDDI